METEYEMQDAERVIISLANSYAYVKQRKENEQPESESTTSPTEVASSLQYLIDKIWNNNTSKQVNKAPKLLQSLIALVTFRLDEHISEELDQQIFSFRSRSRDCLYQIQFSSDEQDQSELVNQEYGRMICISISAAGGKGEEQDEEILSGLYRIYMLFSELHEGRNSNQQPSFYPLPLFTQRSIEQIKEEGAIEEIEAQMNNNVYNDSIKKNAYYAKVAILNRFIRRRWI
ncbi:MAG: hypothetical protein EZS28_002686 [Streblomastix strix]|uniref:Uncharacterized protein n=1 Tax=Streblomastix strix TaxID=222440 RepID=A0A5J4X4T0_9EUKA|nr:MAG: hypothetical protein EZS28_002686 [Streblomastix strix]